MNSQLSVKTVPFMGDELMAAKDEKTGKIYAGVSYICKGIGFTKHEKDRQVANIQKDEVLKRGCLKFEAGVFDPNNEALAIENDFIPLWLAKISITPAMQKERPEVANKLVQYQLKAQKVLADAFLHPAKAPSSGKKFSLASFNHLLEINIRQMKAAAEPAPHIAAWTNGMTRDVLAPFGINVPALPDAVPPTYDATEIAKQLGIYSKAGRPHPQPITAIIKEVGLAPGETFITATTAHGGRKDVPDVRYTGSVLEKVHNWLNASGWPNPIVLGKRFNVIYKYGVNPPQTETASASMPQTCC